MSKPRYRWWGFVRAMIRDYQKLQKDLEELHSQNITAVSTGMPRGGGTGRTVESVATRQLPKDDQAVYDAVSRAVAITQIRPDGKERMALIRMMYWEKKTSSAKNAAISLHISDVTAKRWHGAFVRLVGQCYGFDSGKDDTQKPKNGAKIVL